MVEEYFTRPYGNIRYNPATKTGFGVWVGFLSSHEYRELAEKCMELIIEKDLHFWLSDNRKMKAIRQQDQDWTLKVIAPKLLESPLRKMATLVSEDIFNKMAVESLINRAFNLFDFENRYFRNEADALNWLENLETGTTNELESESELTELSE